MRTLDKWVDVGCKDIAKLPRTPSIVSLGNKIYILGGGDGVVTSPTAVNSVFCYDLATDMLTAKKPTPTKRTAGSAVVYNGKLYFAGGYDYGNAYKALNTLEEYDPNTDTWTSLAACPQRFYENGYCVAGDRLYIAGGKYYQSGVTNSYLDYKTLYAYSFTEKRWIKLADMPEPLNASGNMVYHNGGLFVYGGTNPALATTTTIYRYDIALNAWGTAGTTPTRMPLQIGDKAFLLGGDKQIQDMKTGIYHYMADAGGYIGTYCGGKIYTFSLTTPYSATNTIKSYDPVSLVTRQYLDETGKTIRTQDAAARVELGANYSAAAPGIAGYTYTGYRVNGGAMQTGSTASLTDIWDDQAIVYYYNGEKNVTVRYLDDSGNEVLPGKSAKVKLGAGYSVSAPEIPGYLYRGYRLNGGALTPDPTVNLTDIRADQTVIFTYSKLVSVTCRYHDGDGSELLPEESVELEPGSNYSVTAPAIPGYTRIGYRLNGGELLAGLAVDLTDIREDQVITFLYAKGEEENDMNETLKGCLQVEMILKPGCSEELMRRLCALIAAGDGTCDCECACDDDAAAEEEIL